MTSIRSVKAFQAARSLSQRFQWCDSLCLHPWKYDQYSCTLGLQQFPRMAGSQRALSGRHWARITIVVEMLTTNWHAMITYRNLRRLMFLRRIWTRKSAKEILPKHGLRTIKGCSMKSNLTA